MEMYYFAKCDLTETIIYCCISDLSQYIYFSHFFFSHAKIFKTTGPFADVVKILCFLI